MEEDSEIARLRVELADVKSTLEAIRGGQVDALVVESAGAEEVVTLQSADLPFHELVEVMAEGVVSLHRAHAIGYCNGFFAQLVGVPREILLGRSFLDSLAPASRDAFSAAVAGGQIVKVAADLIGADGELVPVQLAISPSGVRSSRRTTVIVSDLRVLRALARVAEDRDAVRADSDAKDTFIAILGHELRNPLSALTMGMAVLQSEPDVRRARRVRDAMDRQITQLRSLVDDLLEASRVARGKITLSPAEVSLRDLTSGVVEATRASYEERGQRLHVDIEPAELAIVADPTRIEQILVNIVGNAGRYSPDGSTVRLRAREVGEGVEITITDQGKGLSKDDLERIFEPFTQVGRTTGGLGIGLTVVRQLVALHGGTVKAESQGLGLGSTFVVTLPRRPAVFGQKPPPQPAPPSEPLGDVLVVDDHVDGAEVLRIALEAKGVRAHVCHTGADALTTSIAHQPAIILLDLALPDATGYAVMERLRAHGLKSRIFAITGFSDPTTRQRIEEAGFEGHLIKPIRVDDVFALVAERTGRSSSARGAERDVAEQQAEVFDREARLGK